MMMTTLLGGSATGNDKGWATTGYRAEDNDRDLRGLSSLVSLRQPCSCISETTGRRPWSLQGRYRDVADLRWERIDSDLTTGDQRNDFRILNKPKSLHSISTRSSSVTKEAMAKNGAPLLNAVNDSHGGVLVDMKEPISPQEFGDLLGASISQWRAHEKKGVWIKLPIELANLVEIAVKEGFRYHHAEPDYVMLVHWIPQTADTLPANASHRVGIGAFVMNDKREVLVVQEKSGRFKGSGVWKYPTGVVNEGEDICTAAIREVKEETGIDTDFVEVLALRQSHKSFFTKSDLFFVCVMKPRSFDIQAQITEIEEAKWMPVEEYATQPFIQDHDLFNLVAKICRAKSDDDYTGFSPRSTTTASGKTSYLYVNSQYLDRLQPSGDLH